MIAPSTMPMTGSSEMTVIPPESNTALADTPQAERGPVSSFAGDINSPSIVAHVEKLATLLAHSAFVPKHLVVANDPQRTVATCFRIAAQAVRWGFDPFALADETYTIGGKLGYQGKLIAALINARAGLDGKLDYKFSGTGDGLTVEVVGKFKSELTPRTVTATVAQARTSNEMWKKDPEQKRCYIGAIKWARRHWPEGVTGVLTTDDLEVIAEQEPVPPVDPEIVAAKRLEAAQAQAKALAAVAKPAAVATATTAAATEPAITVASTQAPATTGKSKKVATEDRPNPATTMATEATRNRIKVLLETTTIEPEMFQAKMEGSFKAKALRNLTELQALELAGWLLVHQPDHGPEIEPIVAAEVAAVEQPTEQHAEQSSIPQADSEAIVDATATATADAAPSLNDARGSLTATQKARLGELIKKLAWPVEGGDGQKAYLAKKGVATWTQLSEAQAAKAIESLMKLAGEDIPF